MQSATCICGHTAPIDDGPPPAASVLVCSECNTRTSYGVVMPRIVVEPCAVNHKGFVRVKFQDPVTKADLYTATLDPQYAVMFVKNVLALVTP